MILEGVSRFDVGVVSVMLWLKGVSPNPYGRRYRKMNMKALAADVRDDPDAY